jgi:N-acetyl-gamma-glutamylphosphate reductase
MPAKLKTAVLGASGYSGLELTRILERHPRLEKPVLLRREGGTDARQIWQRCFRSCPAMVAIRCDRCRGRN